MMKRFGILLLITLAAVTASGQSIPSNAAYCLYNGGWIPLHASLGIYLPAPPPAVALYGSNGSAWYPLACDVNGNLQASAPTTAQVQSAINGQAITPSTVAVGATNPVTIGGATGSCVGEYAKADGTGCAIPTSASLCHLASASGFLLNDTDESSAFLAFIQNAYDAGISSCLAIDKGTLRVDSQITIPPAAYFAASPTVPTGTTRLFLDAITDGICTGGGTSQAQCKWNGSAWVTAANWAMPTLRITGPGPAIGAADNLLSTLPGGAQLDLRYAGNRIIALGQGVLQIDNTSIINGGSSCGTFFYTTLTNFQFWNNSVLGTSAYIYDNACDDVWHGGGNNAPNAGLKGSVNDYFQGYGSAFYNNFADQIKHLIVGGSAFNAVSIFNNKVWQRSGSNETTPITAASNATSVALTSIAHSLPNGSAQQLTFSGFTGSWTSLNGQYIATVTDNDTFTLPINSSSFGALTGTPAYRSGAIIEINNPAGTAYNGDGVVNNIFGNLFELGHHAYAVKIIHGSGNNIFGNSCVDMSMANACVWADTSTVYTYVEGGSFAREIDNQSAGGTPVIGGDFLQFGSSSVTGGDILIYTTPLNRSLRINNGSLHFSNNTGISNVNAGGGFTFNSDGSITWNRSVGGNTLNINDSGLSWLHPLPVASYGVCSAASLSLVVRVNDATSATPGTTATGGGGYDIHMECIYNSSSSAYTWIID